MPSPFPRVWAACAAALAFSACGPNLDFRQARYLEDSRQSLRAAKAYEAFLARYPADRRVPEALFRAGRIYAFSFERCPQAAAHFERVARMPAAEAGPWGPRARDALLDCPDYFPLRDGAAWVYVDTLSAGKNMRLEARLSLSSASAQGEVAGAYFAGAKKFREYRRSVAKSDWSVWEGEGEARLPILKYPFRKGQVWTASEGGRPVRFLIESDSLGVRTQAGDFSGCIKVRRQARGDPAWVYDYYCPGVGRVKTTIGVPGKENPNTELASYLIR